jgi:hypothetical protein
MSCRLAKLTSGHGHNHGVLAYSKAADKDGSFVIHGSLHSRMSSKTEERCTIRGGMTAKEYRGLVCRHQTGIANHVRAQDRGSLRRLLGSAISPPRGTEHKITPPSDREQTHGKMSVMALSRHVQGADECPLSRVKRTDVARTGRYVG